MEESVVSELRQTVTGGHGLRLLYTDNLKVPRKIHIVSHDTRPYLRNREWCLASLNREAERCLIYDCSSLTDRLLVFIGRNPTGQCVSTIKSDSSSLTAPGDMTHALRDYVEVSTDYRWPVILRVHLVFAGAESLVRDLIAEKSNE